MMTNGWQFAKIGEVAAPIERAEEPQAGTTYRQVGVRLWGQGAYERESIDGSETKYKTLSRIESGDIIVNKIWARNGSVAVVSDALAGCFGSSEFPAFAPDRNKLEPKWFHWITKTRWFWDACDEKSQGTSGKNRIRPEKFLEIEIPLPPLTEQRRIMAHIESLATRVNDAQRLREEAGNETNSLTHSALNAVFNDSFAQKYPTHLLGDIADIRSGVTLGRTLQGNTVRLPYLRVANVQDGYLDLRQIKEVEVLESEKDKWQLQRGDILLTEGGDWDKLGRGAVWREEIPNCIHQNHIFRVRVNQDEFVPEYLAMLIGSPYGKNYFRAASKQTTNLASINHRQLKAFTVVRPPLDEQRRIVAYLDGLQAKVKALRGLQVKGGEELSALMASILDKAFKGEL